jgi:hypothetical protein
MAVDPEAVDPRADHWLWRLDADAWLRAASTELAAGEAHLDSRRTAVTHARRAAGMALNAVLVTLGDGDPDDLEPPEQRWGRSYIDHLRALADADDRRAHPLCAATRAAAARLLAIPVMPAPALVQLGRGPHSAAQQALAAAREILDDSARTIAHLSSKTD